MDPEDPRPRPRVGEMVCDCRFAHQRIAEVDPAKLARHCSM